MRIGNLSRRSGVAVRLLRYYEEQGLLHPRRAPSGYREYTEGDVETVRLIRSLLAAGLPTATIAVVLPCVRGRGHEVAATCAEMRQPLQRERERMDAAITELTSARTLLDAIIAATPAEDAPAKGPSPQTTPTQDPESGSATRTTQAAEPAA